MNLCNLKSVFFLTLGAPLCVKSVSKRSKILLFIFVDNFKPSSMVKTNLKNFESLRSYMSISTPYIDISWWIKNDTENTFVNDAIRSLLVRNEPKEREEILKQPLFRHSFLPLTLTTSGETYCSGSMKRAIAFVCLYQDVDVFSQLHGLYR